MGLFLRKSKSLFPVTFGDPLTTPFKEAKEASMSSSALVPVPFHGTQLFLVTHNDQPYHLQASSRILTEIYNMARARRLP